MELRLSAVLAEQVVVSAEQHEPGSITTRVTLAGDAVRRGPSRLRNRGLQDAIATTPGWATEDNGLLHVRGVDDGFLYVIDGVPVYERLDGLFGVAPDPAMIDSVSVLTGYVPPEFGFKSGGVIEVRSAARGADTWLGNVDVGAGSDDVREFSTVAATPSSGARRSGSSRSSVESDRCAMGVQLWESVQWNAFRSRPHHPDRSSCQIPLSPATAL
jgi:hypothetical protein